MMSITAASLGWEAWEPVTLPGFDVLTLRGREAAGKFLRNLDPDFVVMAPPCTEWSHLQKEVPWDRLRTPQSWYDFNDEKDKEEAEKACSSGHMTTLKANSAGSSDGSAEVVKGK